MLRGILDPTTFDQSPFQKTGISRREDVHRGKQKHGCKKEQSETNVILLSARQAVVSSSPSAEAPNAFGKRLHIHSSPPGLSAEFSRLPSPIVISSSFL